MSEYRKRIQLGLAKVFSVSRQSIRLPRALQMKHLIENWHKSNYFIRMSKIIVQISKVSMNRRNHAPRRCAKQKSLRTWSIYRIFEALSHPQSLAVVPKCPSARSTTSQGPFSVKSPIIELEPGPPFSHTVNCVVGSRAAMNQKNVFVE